MPILDFMLPGIGTLLIIRNRDTRWYLPQVTGTFAGWKAGDNELAIECGRIAVYLQAHLGQSRPRGWP